MTTTTTTTEPTTAAVSVSGRLHAVTAHPDGSVTLRPAPGQAITVTPGQAEQTPATEARPGCECAAAPRPLPAYAADVLQAQAISRHLATAYGMPDRRRAVGYDDEHQAAAVRVDSPHGLYALLIPPTGHVFPVLFRSARIGSLNVRRGPGTSDEMAGTLFAAFLRDRGDLDLN